MTPPEDQKDQVEVREREWEYMPGWDGEPVIDKDGNEVLGWHDRTKDQDEFALLSEFQAYYRSTASPERVDVSLTLRPILMREATEVECRINGWEEGSFTRCTTRAKKSWPMWQIEASPEEATDA
jgi:hypothetical protein